MNHIEAILSVNYWEARQLVALANFFVCSAIGWACLCRISVTSSDTTRTLTRWSYAGLFVAATASGFGPLKDYWPGVPTLAMSVAVLLLLLDGVPQWRHGVPPDVRTDLDHFDSKPHAHH